MIAYMWWRYRITICFLAVMTVVMAILALVAP